MSGVNRFQRWLSSNFLHLSLTWSKGLTRLLCSLLLNHHAKLNTKWAGCSAAYRLELSCRRKAQMCDRRICSIAVTTSRIGVVTSIVIRICNCANTQSTAHRTVNKIRCLAVTNSFYANFGFIWNHIWDANGAFVSCHGAAVVGCDGVFQDAPRNGFRITWPIIRVIDWKESQNTVKRQTMIALS